MKSSYGAVHWFGFAAMMAAMIWSNFVVSRMAKLVRVDWYVKSDRASRETIRKYREKYGNGPLFRQFVIACGVFAIAVMVFIFGK